MAVVGNQIKQLTSLLLLCIVISAVIRPPWAEAQVSCRDLVTKLVPCLNYVLIGGTIPAACCQAMKTVVDSLKTKIDRQSACACMKQEVSKLTPDQLTRAQSISDYCKVPLPFKIGNDVDCSLVPKIIVN